MNAATLVTMHGREHWASLCRAFACPARALLLLGLAFAALPIKPVEAQDRQKAIVRPAPRVAALPLIDAGQPWSDEQFALYVFRKDRTIESALQKLESILRVQLDDMERTCQLSPAQRSKLELMGRGDIKRFLQDFDSAKQRFHELDNDGQRIQEIMPEIQKLRGATQGDLFRAKSLFSKSLRSTLSAEQLAKYEEVTQERRAFHHQAQIKTAIAVLEQTMPLRSNQRRELAVLLEKEIKPARQPSPYELYRIMDRIRRLPEAKIKPLLSDRQWKAVLERAAQYSQVVPGLRANGLMLDDADDPPAARRE